MDRLDSRPRRRIREAAAYRRRHRFLRKDLQEQAERTFYQSMKGLGQPAFDCHGCLTLFLAGFLLLSTSIAQTLKRSHTLSPDAKEAMIAEIAGGRSLLEAGKTGDPALITPLRS